MGFKLGTGKQPHAVSGEIKTKFRFHQESGDPNVSVPGTPIIRKNLAPGIMGEANADGSIYISNRIQPGSELEKQVINHEMRHATDMKISPNKLSYTDDYVKYDGVVYPRETRNGKDMIQVDGKWREAGTHDFPWEVDANNGNGNI